MSENNLKEFSQALKKLQTRFQDFKNIQSSLDVFSMPFDVDPENVPAEFAFVSYWKIKYPFKEIVLEFHKTRFL